MQCMSKLEKRLRSLESQLRSLENGPKRVKLSTSKHQVDTDLLISRVLKTLEKIKEKKLSIVESHLKNKEKTSKDNLTKPKNSIQNTNRSKTSGQDSISKDPALCPYWTELCVEKSKKLLSSIGTDCVVSDSNSLSTSVKDSRPKSLFTIEKKVNLQNKSCVKTLCQSSTSFLVDKWVPGDTKGSKKIRITPTTDQQQVLKTWMGDARMSYNQTVDLLKNQKTKSDKYQMRNIVAIKKNNLASNHLHIFERTPKDIRAKAVFEACQAHDLCVSTKDETEVYKNISKILSSLKLKLKKIEELYLKIDLLEEQLDKLRDSKNKKKYEQVLNKGWKLEDKVSELSNGLTYIEIKSKISYLEQTLKNVQRYEPRQSNVKYRKKKNRYCHIWIPKNLSKIRDKYLTIYPSFLKGDKEIPCHETFDITADFMIRYDRLLNTWEVIISSPISQLGNLVGGRLVCFDPGIRTFLTGVDLNGNVLEIGQDLIENKKIEERIIKSDY